jgi:hypothetical protein
LFIPKNEEPPPFFERGRPAVAGLPASPQVWTRRTTTPQEPASKSNSQSKNQHGENAPSGETTRPTQHAEEPEEYSNQATPASQRRPTPK